MSSKAAWPSASSSFTTFSKSQDSDQDSKLRIMVRFMMFSVSLASRSGASVPRATLLRPFLIRSSNSYMASQRDRGLGSGLGLLMELVQYLLLFGSTVWE